MNLRRGVRALVIDEQEHLALVRFDHPDRTVWATPGGGIERDESEHDALRRELWEELGLEAPETLGTHVWERTHAFPMTHWDGQTERFYLVRVPAFAIRPAVGWEALRREGIGDVRWWTLDELHAATDVIFAPALLAHFLEQLLRDGPPAVALDIGV